MTIFDEDRGIVVIPINRLGGYLDIKNRYWLDRAKDYFIVKAKGNNESVIYISRISMPTSWLGKKVRIKIEEVKNEPIVNFEREDWNLENIKEPSIREEKQLEEYHLDKSVSHVFLCAKCKEEKECLCCSNCDGWYCRRHISLQETNRVLCDDCYTKMDLRKMTIGDTPDEKIIKALKEMENDNKS